MFTSVRSRIAAAVALVLFAGVIVLALLVSEGPSKPENPVATIQVVGETYKIELTTPENLQIARDLLAGKKAPSIPNGKVVRDEPGVNAPWSWHIDPATLEWADQTIEVCDGLPSYVEDLTVTSDYYCPWSAKVIAIDE
ncbi:hypothetical protein BH11ACT3_BH11ACT3_13590 [soil metagenome]